MSGFLPSHPERTAGLKLGAGDLRSVVCAGSGDPRTAGGDLHTTDAPVALVARNQSRNATRGLLSEQQSLVFRTQVGEQSVLPILTSAAPMLREPDAVSRVLGSNFPVRTAPRFASDFEISGNVASEQSML